MDAKAAYQGQEGVEVAWTRYTTTAPYGVVDLNKVLGKQKGVVAYAYAVIESPTERPIQILRRLAQRHQDLPQRQGSVSRDEYHHGMEMDQYIANAMLKAGRNELLLKVCQNEQTEDWRSNGASRCVCATPRVRPCRIPSP